MSRLHKPKAGFWIRLCVVILYPLDALLFRIRWRHLDRVPPPSSGAVIIAMNHVSHRGHRADGAAGVGFRSDTPLPGQGRPLPAGRGRSGHARREADPGATAARPTRRSRCDDAVAALQIRRGGRDLPGRDDHPRSRTVADGGQDRDRPPGPAVPGHAGRAGGSVGRAAAQVAALVAQARPARCPGLGRPSAGPAALPGPRAVGREPARDHRRDHGRGARAGRRVARRAGSGVAFFKPTRRFVDKPAAGDGPADRPAWHG